MGLTLAFYALLLPIRSSYFAELFYDRGWVPYVEVLLTMWAVAVLYLKYRKLARQKASMLFGWPTTCKLAPGSGAWLARAIATAPFGRSSASMSARLRSRSLASTRPR